MVPPGGIIALGVLVGLLSTSIQSVGLTLQRKSHLLEDEKNEQHTKRPPYRRRRWQLGMLMFIIANLVGSTIQITTLPLPVLSTLQASGLVFNSICASIILHEPFTRYSFAGTILVAGGAALIALYGALPEPSHSLSQLMFLLGRAQFIGWIIATFVLVAVLIAWAWVLTRLSNPASRMSTTAGVPWIGRVKLLRGMSYGCISGILSAHTLLLAKSAVELLVTTFTSENQFNQYQSWLILVGLVILALSQLFYLHSGLKLCSTSVLYPFVFCIYNITAILDGLIYFDQSSRLPPLHAGLIAIGTLILLSGVVALSWRLDQGHGSPGHHRRASGPATPAVPGAAFAPGLGYVEDECPDTDSDLDAEDSEQRAARDEESAIGVNDVDEDGEHSPLLFKQQRRRTMATPNISQSSEIWDELHDTGTYGSLSISKPRASRSRARSAAGVLGRRVQSGDASGLGEESLRRKSTTGRRSSRRMSRVTSFGWSKGKPRQDALGGWFKLDWWKRRMGRGREGDGDGGGGGENGGPGPASA
ncbi:MAG: hypothetical protein M1820_002070 [Bogoriella megaspora]|nr:MAG: hypothetical protein M1820_002070 [Bogoriella megaspora]